MEYTPRKLLFKAWNRETGLLMRLNQIECVKGELFRKDHILLQFTGLHDQQDEEIYEMDMIMIGRERFVVIWHSPEGRWGLSPAAGGVVRPFLRGDAKKAIRICSYFESARGERTT